MIEIQMAQALLNICGGTSNQIEKEILILSRIGWIYSGIGYSALTHFCEEYLQH